MKNQIFKSSLIALCSGIVLTACNNAHTGSGLTVAGGEVDGEGNNASYPATVYVEIKAEDFSDPGKIRTIRNVGTIVDVGDSTRYGLIVSLADAMMNYQGLQVLPVFKDVQINLISSDGNKSVIKLDPMQMDIKGKSGLFKTLSGETYPLITVGVKAQRIEDSSLKESEVVSMSNQVSLEDKLDLPNGRNLRIQETSYMMIGVPKSKIASAKIPTVLPAGSRKSGSKFVMVGYGETKFKASGSDSSKLALSNEIPNIMKRNFAEVELLSDTPLSKITSSNKNVADQLWEVKGSALCGSTDGANYDTGAAVYQDGNFVGFAVRSTAISAGFMGKLLRCDFKEKVDMATLVVSPSAAAIQKFKSALSSSK